MTDTDTNSDKCNQNDSKIKEHPQQERSPELELLKSTTK